jgi:hypothetical protein
MAEDATAQNPFSIAATAAEMPVEAGDPAWVSPFQLKSVPLSGITTPADGDADNGGNGWGWGAVAAAAGSLALGAAILRGKRLPVSAQQVVRDVDSPRAASRMEPTPVDVPPDVEATPRTRAQKMRAGVEKNAPIRQVAENALQGDPNADVKLGRINREVGEASRLEVSNATYRTMFTGEVPFLNRRTVPTRFLRRAQSQWNPDQHAKFQQYAAYVDQLDKYELTSIKLSDKIAQLNIDLRDARGPVARQKILNDIMTNQMELRRRQNVDAPVAGSITRREIEALKDAVHADPKIMEVINGLKRIRDDINESGVAAGQYTQAYIDHMARSRPNFLPMSMDPHADTNFMQRIARKFKGRYEPGEGASDWSTPMYGGNRTALRTNRLVEGVEATKLKDPISAMEEAIFEYHRILRSHRAAQTFTETMMETGGYDPWNPRTTARNGWGVAVKRAAPPMSLQTWEKNGARVQALKNNPNVYAYVKNGQVHVMEAADAEVAKAMRFNPSSAMAIANTVRRIRQWTRTGPGAPWFAPISAEYELGVARGTLDPQYSIGMIQKYLRGAFPEHKVAEGAALFNDPTFRLQQIGAIGEMISAKALNALVDHMAKRLDNYSPFLASTGNSRMMSMVGIRTVNDWRQRLQFFQNQGIINTMHDIVDPNEAIFRRANKFWDSTAGQGLSGLGHAYMGLLNTVRDSAKYAIAAQNLDLLSRKYGGMERIPNDVMRKFVHDMKYLSGDMTKAMGNQSVAKWVNIVPYGQTSVNSLLHVTDNFLNAKGLSGKAYVGSRYVMNWVVPKLFWMALLTGMFWKRDPETGKQVNEFSDELWDRMKEIDVSGSVPMLSPEYMAAVIGGNAREPTMNDVIFMKQAPEASVYSETAVTMARAAGLFGPHAQDTTTASDFLNGLQTLLPYQFPFMDIVDAVRGRDRSKYDGPGEIGDSDATRMVTDVVGAIVGASSDMIGAGMSAASNSWERSESFGKVMSNIFGYTIEGAVQKLPEPVGSMFGGIRRHYTRGQVRERNTDTFKKIDQVSNLLSEMNKDLHGRMGELGVPPVTDPAALRMMNELKGTADAGLMLDLKTKRSDKYSMLERMDINRERMRPHEYTIKSEALKQEIQDLDLQEQELFQRLNTRLRGDYEHLGVTDIDSAIAYIKQHATRQP